MPTTKQRITITATGDIERILEIEAQLHPELTPAALVAELIRRGHVGPENVGRRQLVDALSGQVSFPDRYLDDLRNEWPS